MISKKVYIFKKLIFQFLNFLDFFPENVLLADQCSAICSQAAELHTKCHQGYETFNLHSFLWKKGLCKKRGYYS